MEELVRPRIARNETTMREVNEAIERGLRPGGSVSNAFRCECAQDRCNELLEIESGDYERVRANSRWFVVLPGHAQPEADNVVESHPGYVIVEERNEAGRIADACNPRARSGNSA